MYEKQKRQSGGAFRVHKMPVWFWPVLLLGLMTCLPYFTLTGGALAQNSGGDPTPQQENSCPPDLSQSCDGGISCPIVQCSSQECYTTQILCNQKQEIGPPYYITQYWYQPQTSYIIYSGNPCTYQATLGPYSNGSCGENGCQTMCNTGGDV